MIHPTYRKRIVKSGGSLLFTLPANICHRLKLNAGDAVLVTSDDVTIIATPYKLNQPKGAKQNENKNKR